MNRRQLEHVIAAAANVVAEDAFIVVGSQAILGSHPDAPLELLRSAEADIYPEAAPERAIEIDGSLGDGSRFHQTFGYYAHGVGPGTAQAPSGWEDRLIRMEIPARPSSDRRPVAYCLEPHDLVLAKCAAGRGKDWKFARDTIAAGLVEIATLLERVDALPVQVELSSEIRVHLLALGGC